MYYFVPATVFEKFKVNGATDVQVLKVSVPMSAASFSVGNQPNPQ